MVALGGTQSCKVARIKGALTAEDLEVLARLESETTPTEIARVLREDGYGIADTTVRAHYRGDCTCGTR